MCQKTNRNLSFSKMCQKSVQIVQKMYQKSVRIHNCVKIVSNCCTKMCQLSVISLHSDTFPTPDMKYFRKHWQQKTVTNLSKVNIWYISDTLWRKHFQNVSLEMRQKSVKPILLTDFWYISNSAFYVTLNCQFVRNLSKCILLTDFWYISNSNFRGCNYKCVGNLSNLSWYIFNSNSIDFNHKCVRD